MVDISRRSFTVMTVFGPLIGRAALPEHDRVARARVSGPPIDGPDSLRIEWLPAPYQQYGTDPVKYGNHDVAHRPSTVALADRVLLMVDGAVVAEGTHAELMDSSEQYRQLMTMEEG